MAPEPLTLFTGRFGSGKTEVAINYAVQESGSVGRPATAKPTRSGRRSTQYPWVSLTEPAGLYFPIRQETRSREQKSCLLPSASCVILVDLDIVTPYFRSRETADTLRELGVEVIAPSVVGQHLDTPAITPQILGAIQQSGRPVVVDVGGDRQGARALGQFSSAIRQRGYTMHFVVNPYRPFTDTLEGLARSIAEIEASARLQVTSLVSNPNLMGETTAEQIVEGHAKIEGFARKLGLPIAFVCLERRWLGALGSNHFAQPILALERYFVMSWE